MFCCLMALSIFILDETDILLEENEDSFGKVEEKSSGQNENEKNKKNPNASNLSE